MVASCNNQERAQAEHQDHHGAEHSVHPVVPSLLKITSHVDRNILNNCGDVNDSDRVIPTSGFFEELVRIASVFALLCLFFLFPTGMAAPESTDVAQGSYNESAAVDVQDSDDACPTSPENVPSHRAPVYASNNVCPTIHRTELFHLEEFMCFHRTEMFNQGDFPPFDLPNEITSLHTICPTTRPCFQDDIHHRTELFRLANHAQPTTKKKKRTRPTWNTETSGANHTSQPPDPGGGGGSSLRFFLSLLLASLVVCHVIAYRYPLDTAAEQAVFVYFVPSPSILWTLRRHENSQPRPLPEFPYRHMQDADIDRENTMEQEVGITPQVGTTLLVTKTCVMASLLPSLTQGRREGAMTGKQNSGMVTGLATPTELRLDEMVTGRQVRRGQVGVETNLIVVSAPAGVISMLDCQGSILKKDEWDGDMKHAKSHGSVKVDELFDVRTRTATKVSAEGHKAASSYSYIKALRMRQEGAVLCLYLPNPPSNTTQVRARTADPSVTEMGIGVLLENGLAANVCVVESASVGEDLEFLPPLEDGGVSDHPQLVDEQVVLFDNSEHNFRPFRESYGPSTLN